MFTIQGETNQHKSSKSPAMVYHSTSPDFDTKKQSTLTKEKTFGFTLVENSIVTVHRPPSLVKKGTVCIDHSLGQGSLGHSNCYHLDVLGSEMYLWSPKS